MCLSWVCGCHLLPILTWLPRCACLHPDRLRTPALWNQGPPQWPLVTLNHLHKGPAPNTVPSEYWELGLQHVGAGGHNSVRNRWARRDGNSKLSLGLARPRDMGVHEVSEILTSQKHSHTYCSFLKSKGWQMVCWVGWGQDWLIYLNLELSFLSVLVWPGLFFTVITKMVWNYGSAEKCCPLYFKARIWCFGSYPIW